MSPMLNADGVDHGGMGMMGDFATCPLVSGFVFVAWSDLVLTESSDRQVFRPRLYGDGRLAGPAPLRCVVPCIFYVMFQGSTWQILFRTVIYTCYCLSLV